MTTTQIETPSKATLLFRRPSGESTSSTLPPEYDTGNSIELGALSSTSSVSTNSPPGYDAALEPAEASSSSSPSTGFYSTKAFQIESAGHPLCSLPLPPRPVPIPVYNVDPSTGNLAAVAYESIRPTRNSGNSLLVRAGDSEDHPVCLTTYRFGPGRPPKIQLTGALAHDEEFEVTSKGFTTRSQILRTHLGTFQWRYANRQERRDAGANNLLVLDQIIKVALEGGKQEEHRRPVAKLIRNEEFRTEGSKGSTAGNGGRLVMDLREWMGTKGEDEQMETLVVASCIVMLKKEVDRRRLHQAVVIAGAVSGGS